MRTAKLAEAREKELVQVSELRRKIFDMLADNLNQTKQQIKASCVQKAWLVRTKGVYHILASSVEGTPKELWLTRCRWRPGAATSSWALVKEDVAEADGSRPICGRCWKA